MTKVNKFVTTVVAIAVIVVCIVVVFLVKTCQSSSVTLEVGEKINKTPISVERMRQIGEWEFLCITDEEMVDTVRKHFLGDDELVRIYYGQLRLGIDMKEIADDAITVVDDSVSIVLPEVKLLDENFIDEARTRSFYETGKWSGADREALYQKAKSQMLRKCYTQQNKQAARENAIVQMSRMLKTLGVEKVNIR